MTHFQKYLFLFLLILGKIGLPAFGDTLPSVLRTVHPEPKPLRIVPKETPDGKIRLRIVTYNDFHGSFREKNISLGAAKFVTALDEYVETYPKDRPTAVCVFNGGDNFSGTALARYSMYETKKNGGAEKRPSPLERFFHRSGTMLSCIGNHEFDWEPGFLVEHLRNSTVLIDNRRFPTYSSSNVTEEATGLPPGGIPSYELLEIPEVGFRLAVLTFTTLETAQKTTTGATAGYRFEKPAAAALRILPQIPNTDAVLFVAHLASYQDKDGRINFGRETENMSELVRLKPIAIVSAHSHRFVSGPMDGVPIIQAGCYANGLASLNFLIEAKTKKIELESQETVDLRPRRNELRPDSAMERIVADAVAACGFTRIGTVREEMVSDRRKLTDIGVLISKAVAAGFRERTGDEPVLGFQHSGGIRSNFPKGEITEEDCYDMLPFQGGETLCRLSGADVIRLMREGFVNPVGYLQSYGLTFYYDQPDAPKQNFTRMTFQHRGRNIRIEPDEKYWVVLDSFLVAGGDGYPTDLFEGKIVVSEGPQSRDLLMRYCRDDLNGDVHVEDGDRLKFVVE